MFSLHSNRKISKNVCNYRKNSFYIIGHWLLKTMRNLELASISSKMPRFVSDHYNGRKLSPRVENVKFIFNKKRNWSTQSSKYNLHSLKLSSFQKGKFTFVVYFGIKSSELLVDRFKYRKSSAAALTYGVVKFHWKDCCSTKSVVLDPCNLSSIFQSQLI